MTIVGFLLPWLLIGLAVFFIAFSGGPGGSREAYLTRGNRGFILVVVLVYLGIGIAVPAVVIANRGDREGNSNELSQKMIRKQAAQIRRGKMLFAESCAACHNLDAVNARGVTGPDLDKVGTVTQQRILSAIKIGGTGQHRMPSNLLQGENAKAVAAFVTAVAGK